jgi:hypothetical protein
MKREFPELPGWSFEIEELSAGGYHITATAKSGRTFETRGPDLEALLAECRQEVAALSEQAQFERT